MKLKHKKLMIAVFTAVILVTAFSAIAFAASASAALKAPSSLSAKNTDTGIRVTWSAVKNAEGYRIYQRTENDSWRFIAAADKNVRVFETSSGTVYGTQYYYTVKAVAKGRSAEYNKKGVPLLRMSIPKIASALNSAVGVTVKWSAVKGAEGYYLYRRTDASGWSRIGIIAGGALNATDNSALKDGLVYYYTVKAFGKGSVSQHNKTGVSALRLSAPKLVSANSLESGIQLKWGKINGAAGYIVYRKTAGSSWQRLTKLYSSSTVSYCDDSADIKNNSSFIYTVRAFSGKINGSYNTSGIKATFVSTPVLVSAKNSKTSITVKWKAVPDADGYTLYRKSGGSGWKIIYNIPSGEIVSYSDEDVSNNGQYCYTVRAKIDSSRSSYDKDGVTGVFVATPQLNTVKNNENGSLVSWGKISGATKYYLYKRTANSSWTRISTQSGTSYLDTDVKNGARCYYTVRAVIGSVTGGYDSPGRENVFVAAPQLKSAFIVTGGTYVKFERVNGATRYNIYRRAVSGWAKIGAVTGNEAFYFDNSVTPSVYTVVAFCGSFRSAYKSDGITSRNGTKLTGNAVVTANQMISYIKAVNPSVPQSVINMIPYYLSEGAAEGIRGDIAFAQSCLETGNFAFKGSAVTLDQNNFCGMGVTSNGMKGNSFDTPQLGIRAQIQHLKAYANNEPLRNPQIDPRFNYVNRGTAEYLEFLGIQENPWGYGWAGGSGYGDKITSIITRISAY